MAIKHTTLSMAAFLVVAISVLASLVGNVDDTAHAQAAMPSNVSASNGANPGEAVVSWDPVAGASAYRVGWLSVPDYLANRDNNRWQERFVYSDVNAGSPFAVTRLTPGTVYYFIVGWRQGNEIEGWSQWDTLTLNSGALPCPTEPAVAPNTTSTLRVANGSNPGEVAVSWDAVAGATGYRVGWLAVPDYLANRDNNRWQQRFAYSDINPASSFTITRLTPGVAYYFILGSKQGDDITWSQWAALALNADSVACPGAGPTQTFPASAVGGDYDHDDDGLIEVRTLAQLDIVRLDLDGSSMVTIDDLPAYLAAFPNALDDMGCPADGCRGYELASNLDFDTNANGEPDEGDDYWNDGAGWDPIGHTEQYYFSGFPYSGAWAGTFDGNGYAIANLFIHDRSPDPTGLFAYSSGAIRNVVLNEADVTGSGRVGILVGWNYENGDISDSTASGAVDGGANVGGLVGMDEGGKIAGSTANVAVSGSQYVGGLVGTTDEYSTISGSTASGTVSGGFATGGLVGRNEGGTITGSVASGNVSGNDGVGGLVGWNVSGTIDGCMASGNVSGNDRVGGLVGLSLVGSSISGSAASGTVFGNDYVGGLVGSNEYRITGSEAEGDVTGRFYVGGLVGLNNMDGMIDGCTASGNVAGVRWRDPLVGANQNRATVTNSTGTGTVTTVSPQ